LGRLALFTSIVCAITFAKFCLSFNPLLARSLYGWRAPWFSRESI